MIPLFRCDEIYREFTRSDLKKKKSNNERRVVVLTSLDRVGKDEEKRVRQELSELDIKSERKKCERIFLSSAMISADMVPYQGLAGDQVCMVFQMNGNNLVPLIIKNDHLPSLDQIVRLLLHGLEKSGSSTVKSKIREEVQIYLKNI